MSVRARQALRLVRPLARAVNWTAFPPAGGLALLIVWAMATDTHAGMEELIVALRAAAIVLALAAAFALDDAAANIAAASPCPVLLRRSLRIVLVAMPTTSLWMSTMLLAQRKSLAEATALPMGFLTLELTTVVMIGLGVAATAARRGVANSAGRVGASSLLAMTVATWIVPEELRPWVYPSEPSWRTVHMWWAFALTTSLIWLFWVSRETYMKSVSRNGS